MNKLFRLIAIAALVIAPALAMAQGHNPRTSGQMLHNGAATVTGNMTVSGTLTSGATTITTLTGANGEQWSNGTDGLITELYDDDAITLAIKSLASSNTSVEDDNVISRRFVAKDSGGTDTNYVMLDTYLRDVTDLTEDGELAIGYLSGGASKTLFIGSKAGGAQAILPGVTNEIDLGSASLELKDGFFDGTITTDALQHDGLTSGRLTFAGASGLISDLSTVTQSAGVIAAKSYTATNRVTAKKFVSTIEAQGVNAAGNNLYANSSVISVWPTGGNITLTSTPTILNPSIGQTLLIFVIQGAANTLTLNDESTTPGTDLELGAASRTLGEQDTLLLVYTGTEWSEVSFTDVTPGP